MSIVSHILHNICHYYKLYIYIYYKLFEIYINHRNAVHPFVLLYMESPAATSRKVAGSIPDGVIGIFH